MTGMLAVTGKITHIADASEDRGRVVLHVCPGRPDPIALSAAARIAVAFNSTIESVLIADEQLFHLGAYDFVHEISLCGRHTRPFSAEDMAVDTGLMLAAARRDIERMAGDAKLVHHARQSRGAPLDAIAEACAERGPWNVVAFANPIDTNSSPALRFILGGMAGATGVIAVGPRIVRQSGPIVIAIEDADRLAQMLRVADRLAADGDTPIHILPIVLRPSDIALVDEHLRLALADTSAVHLERPLASLGSSAVVAARLHDLRPGLVIAEFGRQAVPDGPEIKALLTTLECPLFLVR